MAKIYVSSTIVDLEPERRAVMDWLVTAGHQPVHSYRPDSEAVRKSCLADIDGCDIYVLILGHRYGYQLEHDNPDNLSITHLEFRRAGLSGIPRIALLRTSVPDIRLSDLLDPRKAALVSAFQDEVRLTVRPAEFSDEGGLIQGLSTGVQGVVDKLRGTDSPTSVDDPRVLQILSTLAEELQRKNRLLDDQAAENASLRGRLTEAENQLRAAAIVRTLDAAAMPGASEAAVAAADALDAGDTRPAEALLSSQEHEEAARIGSPGADDEQQRREAAALAREQGALAMGHDARAALAAFQRAAQYEPDDTWTHFFIGDLLVRLGDLNAAMLSFRSGRAIAEALAERDPANPLWHRDLSVSHERIGNVLVDQGDGLGALAEYRKALAIRQALAPRDPADGWQRDLSVSHNKIGEMLVAQGDGPGALAEYRKALAIREALAAGDPVNSEWQRDLLVSHDRIGEVLVAQGDGPGALAEYRKTLALGEDLAARDPANTERQRDLSVGHIRIADVLVTQGADSEGLGEYRKALAIAESLAARDPANTEWQRDLSVGHNRIGAVLVGQGDGPGALAEYRKALAIAESLAARDPANTQWQRDLSVSHEKIGEVLVVQGEEPAALAEYRKALAIRETLAARDPANTEWQRDLSVSHDKIGDVLVAQGNGPGAFAEYCKALAMQEALAARDPANVQWQTDVATSCAALGTLVDALNATRRREYLVRGREILAALEASGRLLPSQDWTEWFDSQLAELPSEG